MRSNISKNETSLKCYKKPKKKPRASGAFLQFYFDLVLAGTVTFFVVFTFR
jgi:hypothetical protein